jgi:hypothetical protein
MKAIAETDTFFILAAHSATAYASKVHGQVCNPLKIAEQI